MANKHMNRCSTLLIITEKKIKIIMRHHLTPIRMAIIKTSTNIKCMERVTWKLTLPYVKQIVNRNLLCLRELKEGHCNNLEGWNGKGIGREVQEGGDICILMVDSC